MILVACQSLNYPSGVKSHRPIQLLTVSFAVLFLLRVGAQDEEALLRVDAFWVQSEQQPFRPPRRGEHEQPNRCLGGVRG